ncbi:MAG: hypothetical protein P4L87_00920 [Formivibrio sp.]|nr:hypothetical protein [Formivibrio sp.]
MIDPVTIKSWAEATSATFTALRSIISSLPSGRKREEAERLLADAEREQKKAEALIAQRLGFQVCPDCWPPEIMVFSKADGLLHCRQCGQMPRARVYQPKRI